MSVLTLVWRENLEVTAGAKDLLDRSELERLRSERAAVQIVHERALARCAAYFDEIQDLKRRLATSAKISAAARQRRRAFTRASADGARRVVVCRDGTRLHFPSAAAVRKMLLKS